MSESITPDLIARIASRLYNEVPQGGDLPAQPTLPEAGGHPHGMPSAVPAAHAPQPYGAALPGVSSAGVVPVTVASPASIPGQVRSLPLAPGSSSPYSALPGVLTAQQAPPSMSGGMPFGSGYAIPGVGGSHSVPAQLQPATPSGLGSHASHAASSPPSFGQSGVASSPAGGVDLDGLRNFVRRVRSSNTTTGEGYRDSAGPVFARPLNASRVAPTHGARPFDVNAIRADFPILRQMVHGRPLAWFDNAATTQKPQCVIDTISHFYENNNSNIHRAAHTLAARATDAYEGARDKIRAFLNASSVKEIVFVRGTTEGINLIAKTFGEKFLQPGDEIVLSMLEHHAQIVPWQMIAKKQGAVLRVIPVNDNGEIILEEYQKLLGPRTKVVALAHANNSLGTILPVEEMTHAAKRYGARVIIDGAQSVAHIPVDLQRLGADFYVFSGHKIFGPTGIGAVYIKEELHDLLPPWQGGGNMIRNVTFEETSFSEAPAKFEAGTPNIADAVGLGAALEYVQELGLQNIAAYEHGLLMYATEHLSRINGLRIIGTAREKVGVVSFVLPNRRTEEIGKLLDQEGIAVRSGHHCAQPSLRRFGVESTVRPSLSIYNTCEEIDRLVAAVKRIQKMA